MSETTSELVKLKAIQKPVKGIVKLGGSKSISNRALIIQALCENPFEILKLGDSKDTKTLQKLLAQQEGDLNTGHAGTCFRFMTAYLATKEGEQILTGSERMKQRPIAPLVTALNSMGAQIEYIEKEGYPPLRIKSPSTEWNDQVTIDGTMSSQFVTALLLIAPTLPKGLKIHIEGKLVSIPYVEMTLKMLEYFGVNAVWDEQSISIGPQKYTAKDFLVEADWSSASYLYAFAACSPESQIEVHGLFEESLQGDSAIQKFSIPLGVTSEWKDNVLTLRHAEKQEDIFEYNFVRQPDLAQTIAVICAIKNIKGLFNGLQTLFIKETDRVKALQNELAKVNIFFSKLPGKFTKAEDQFFLLEGDLKAPSGSFASYEDHRMAMAFAALACKYDLNIQNPSVVVKSFPSFWKVMEDLGFEVIHQV